MKIEHRTSNIVKQAYRELGLLAIVLLVAAFFRFYGLAWDGGYLFHPDERKILLVAFDLRLPDSLWEFFSSESPLNPKFFAYGSFPIYLLKMLGGFAPATTLNVPWRADFVSLAMLGRALSALFDLGTIVMIFLLGRRLYGATVGLLASACIAVTVLHIQLAHFYTVDTVLTFFVVTTMYFAARYAMTSDRRVAILVGVSFGLALATKITAAPLIVPIAVAVVRARIADQASVVNRLRDEFAKVWSARRALARIFGIALGVFIITQPYVLLDPPRYLGQVGTELLVARGWLDYPYTRQYADTPPFVYHIAQSSLWGMGLPLGVFAWLGSALFAWQWFRARTLRGGEGILSEVEGWRDGFILAWAAFYFLAIGAQYAKYLRYLLPLTPFLFLMATVAFSRLAQFEIRNSKFESRFTFYALRFTLALILLATIVYALAFTSLYGREHPWLAISKWIYANIPPNTGVIVEHWDELIPVSLRLGEPRAPTEYRITMLPLFDEDTPAKRDALVDALVASDYIIVASQRLYGTIPRLPARYPMTARYYRALFAGELGFAPAMHALNTPALDGVIVWADPFARVALAPSFQFDSLALNWGFADESFTVYDHPTPLIFIKTRARSAEELRAVLAGP